MGDQQVLYANNLSYKLPEPMSVLNERLLKRNYFLQRSYQTTQTASCHVQTGSNFIDAKNSALVIRVKAKGNVGETWAATFGENGSILNILDEMRITSRNGTVLTQTRRLNLFNAIRHHYEKNKEWLETIGTLMGYQRLGSDFTNLVEGSDEYEFHLPLPMLHPFWDSENGSQLIPSQLLSGARIDFNFAPASQVFTSDNLAGTDGVITDYEVTDIYFNFMSCDLMDSAVSSISSTASKSSLEYLFRDCFVSENGLGSNNSVINVDSGKSVSFGQEAISVVIPQSQYNDPLADSFKIPYVSARWNYLLGSTRYPQQKVDSQGLSYFKSLQTFDKLSGNKMYLPSLSRQDYLTKLGIYGTSLERDTSLALSHSQINASRRLIFEAELDQAPTEPMIVSVFLTHLVNCRSSLLNTRIDL